MRVRSTAVAACGLVVLVAAAGLWSSANRGGDGAPDDAVSPRTLTFERMRASGEGAVYVDDQPAGAREVSVGFAILPVAGFVVIHADDGGVPGRGIGASSELPPGGGEHVRVALTEPLVAGEVYYAILYPADSEGAFDAPAGPAVDADGNALLMTFVALEGAEPEIGAVEP